MTETEILHLAERARWEARDGAGEAAGYLSYEVADGVIDLQHTVVEPAQRGSGLGGRLVATAIAHARAEQLRVRPTCPFVVSWLEDHPEDQDLVVRDESRERDPGADDERGAEDV